jgi:hypothetical protein
MKPYSMKLLFSLLIVAGLLSLAPSVLADLPPVTTPPTGKVPEGVSTLTVLALALGGIAIGRRFLK